MFPLLSTRCLVSRPPPCSVSARFLPALGHRRCSRSWFLPGAGELSSGSHACKTGALTRCHLPGSTTGTIQMQFFAWTFYQDSIFFLRFIHFYVYECLFACMCITCMRCLRRTEEGTTSLGTGVIDCCESSGLLWKISQRP